MDRVQVRDIEVVHQAAGSGRDVIWGHGLTSSMAAEDRFSFLDHAVLARCCRLLRYDARGHGGSASAPDPTTSSWASLAADQLALAEACGIERYVAAGASMGCGTALHAAVNAPERVEALILVIPPTAWETRQERVDIWRQMADLVDAEGIEGYLAARDAMPEPHPFVGRREWRDASAASLRDTDPGRLAAVLRGAAHADLPPREQIAAITVPSLILAWSGDPGHPVSTAEALAALLGSSTLSIADTWAEFRTWTDQVVEFLASLPEVATGS